MGANAPTAPMLTTPLQVGCNNILSVSAMMRPVGKALVYLKLAPSSYKFMVKYLNGMSLNYHTLSSAFTENGTSWDRAVKRANLSFSSTFFTSFLGFGFSTSGKSSSSKTFFLPL